ncbi:MAG: LysR family transcriptional regulator [Saccharospirillum sp.]
MNISFRQLRLFEATARLGRLTLAAQEQAISQSAATQSIQELERQLGYALLHRQGRVVHLTEAAVQILPRVRQMLLLAESLTQPDHSRISGPLHLAASVTIACYLLPDLLARLTARYPDVQPSVSIVNTEGVLDLLSKGRAHFGLIEGPALHESLIIEPWRSDDLALFCRPDRAPTFLPITMDWLAQQYWLVRERGSGTRAVFDIAMQALGIQPNIRLEMSRQEAIKQAARAGLGIGVLSRLAVAEELDRGSLCELSTPLDLRRQFSWVCSRERLDLPVSQAFLALLGDAKQPEAQHR